MVEEEEEEGGEEEVASLCRVSHSHSLVDKVQFVGNIFCIDI